MNYIKEYIIKNKKKDIILHSFFWMIISVVAAYPDLCLKGDVSVFNTVTRDDYCNKYLLPMMLFLLGFVFDFVFSIKDLNIGQKRGELLKSFIILICSMIFIFCLIIVIPCTCIKIALFILLWFNISLIKGLTVIIPGAEDVVILEVPINNLK